MDKIKVVVVAVAVAAFAFFMGTRVNNLDTIEAATAENTGVWCVEGPNTRSFLECKIDAQGTLGIGLTGIHHDWAVLVNPTIVGDKVYFTDEMMTIDYKDKHSDSRPFFYKEQLTQPKAAYRIKPGAKMYLQKDMEASREDQVDLGEREHTSNQYLIDPPTIMGNATPKVFLDWVKVFNGEQADPKNPNPATDHFYFRHDVELIFGS